MRSRLIAPVLAAGAASVLVLAPGAAVSPTWAHAGTAATRSAAGSQAGALAGTWGKAEEVPGTAALNTGHAAEGRSISCGSAGNCTAGGSIATSAGSQAWVASERNGRWGRAREVAAALNAGGAAEVAWVSCASAGNCAAGGSYSNRPGRLQAFVISEVNGAWGAPRKVAGVLNTGGNAQVYALSCGSAGNCSAGGYYRDRSGHYQAFVITEKHGTWGAAKELAAALNAGGNAAIESVSCASAGNCAAAGQYLDRSRHSQALVVNEVHGRWGAAMRVRGSALLNTRRDARIWSVSCGSAGNCSAGGSYRTGSGHYQAFVVDEVHGRWGKAEEVPGTAALNVGGNASIGSVSCASAGNCSAGGQFVDGSGHTQVFVVGEVHGRWGRAEEVPGTAALNVGGSAQIAVSCPSPGNCSGGGSYADESGHPRHWQAFVVDEVHGRWGRAEEVPGIAALSQGGNAVVQSLSCASASHCSASGYYAQGNSRQQTFVVSKS
jgi:D-alanine-D-alanine ligase-like ATP-grasp enzyme